MNEGGVHKRLSAVIMADVADYTKLMEEDSDATVAAWKAARSTIIDPAIAAHSGRIVKHTGDGFLAEFSTIERAVTCAIAMQLHLKKCPLKFRMGINLGDIIDDGEDIHGEGVNVAARIEGLAAAGGICISGDVYNQVQNKLTHRVEDLGEVEVKNVSGPVRVYRILLKSSQAGGSQRPGRTWLWLALAAAVVLAAVAGGEAWWRQDQKFVAESGQSDGAPTEVAEKPSIAVLPFNNMSQDESQEYFVDGMTEDLITDLSQVSGLFVIARNSTFTYKGRPVKVQDVGRELGAKYVLEGSVRKVGNRVRINAQLVTTKDGHHVWAERFDRDMTDVFTLQDEVTRNIVSALAVKLTGGEQERLERQREATPEAYDALLRGLDLLRRFTPETNAAALEQFERAVALDPTYARAYANVAFTLANNVLVGWVPDRQRNLELALEWASKALELDPSVRQVHFALSTTYMLLNQHEKSIAAAMRAIEVDPNYADGYGQLANVQTYAGQPEDGLKALRAAQKLDPLYPFFYVLIEGRARFQMRRYAEAAALFEDVSRRNPHFIPGRLYLASTYAHLDRLEEADWEVQEALILEPALTLKNVSERAPFKKPEDRAQYIEGLRQAGLPE